MMDSTQKPLVALVGPTAAGKTAASLCIARRFASEIVSVDSMQVYRHMDIGTAKPSRTERELVRHHCLDLVLPDEPYNAALFARDAGHAVTEIETRGGLPLLVGGTGLYLKAFCEGLCEAPDVATAATQLFYAKRMAEEGAPALHAELARLDPEAAARIHPRDRQRIQRGLLIIEGTGRTWTQWILEQKKKTSLPEQKKILLLGLQIDRKDLDLRIQRRCRTMIETGLLDEVRNLLAAGYGAELKSMQSLGYRHMIACLDGRCSLDEACHKMAIDTRRYAKRQMTWFGRNPDILWIHWQDKDKMAATVERFLNSP